MKITSNINYAYASIKNIPQKKSAPAFKGIYIEDNVRLGDVSERSFPPMFLPKDYYILNEFAVKYPNQDCYIRKGKNQFPRLEYREKPPEITMFKENLAKLYEHTIAPYDEEYPCIPLIIYPDSEFNRLIGMTSAKSLNPSLPYTIKAGFEVHKKILEKKYQILEMVGYSEGVSIGNESITNKSIRLTKEVELAVLRYLLECSFTVLMAEKQQDEMYTNVFQQIESRLKAKRQIDLTTSTAKQPIVNTNESSIEKQDICEFAMEKYPNVEENKKRVEDLIEFMLSREIYLG